MSANQTQIVHPNRAKPECKSTRSALVFLLLLTAILTLILLFGGWDKLNGSRVVQFAFAVLYVLLAVRILQWKRGSLPLVAALATIVSVFAIVAGPTWIARDGNGFDNPALGALTIGSLTLALIPLQLLIIAIALKAFNQNWHVEVEQ